jgi:hypothetical protein
MNAKLCFVAAMLAGFGAGVVAAAEAQKPLLVYELTIDGQTFEITDSGPADVTIHGKSVQVSVRIKPIQHYATEAIEFDYDSSLSLRDDFDKEGRTITLVHGSTASIVVTELGEANADGSKPALGHLVERMETRFKRGICKDLEKSSETPARFKGAKGSTATLTYKDEDDEQQTCRIYALESKSRRFSLIVQYGSTEKDTAESLAKISLDSITAK